MAWCIDGGGAAVPVYRSGWNGKLMVGSANMDLNGHGSLLIGLDDVWLSLPMVFIGLSCGFGLDLIGHGHWFGFWAQLM